VYVCLAGAPGSPQYAGVVLATGGTRALLAMPTAWWQALE
jgi:hypothetical protein